ncbi:MAG TPA: hypothetical protein VKC57_17410 [Ktedonobacterales bacterium]|nr:hypothetical protein [Ktedonobacterales bacterium]
MRYRLIPCVALLALVLTACGEASACPPRPDSPGTYAGWPVSLTTDHAVYAPGESPRVTIANLTPDDILTTQRGSPGDWCPPVALQHLAGEQWQEANDCVHVGGGDAAIQSKGLPIAHGRAESSTQVALAAPGSYRFVLSYGPLNRKGLCPCPPPTIVYSAVLRVCTCGVCS